MPYGPPGNKLPFHESFVSFSLAPDNSPYGNAYCCDKTIFLNSTNLFKLDGKDGNLGKKESDESTQTITLFDENETPLLNFIFRHELAHAYHNDSKKKNWISSWIFSNTLLMPTIMSYKNTAGESLDLSRKQYFIPNSFRMYLQMITNASFSILFACILHFSCNGMIINAQEYEADMFAVKHSTAKECYAFADYIESLINQEEKGAFSLKFPFSLLAIPVLTEHPSMRDRCEYLRACAKEKEIQEQKEKIIPYKNIL